jgi:MoaA/NifB/PqqE/SkfB family radical SAM enzyme
VSSSVVFNRQLKQPVHSVNIDILNDCNLGCEYCRVEKGKEYMPLDLFKEIVDSNNNTKFFAVGGGEPLLHPDLEEMINYLLVKEKIINVSTNLTRNINVLTKKLPLIFSESPPNFTLQVNLPASDKELYKEITGRDLFEKVQNHFTQINEIGYNTLVNCPVYKKNIQHIPDHIEFVINELSSKIRINFAYPVGPASDLELPNRDEIQELAIEISRKRLSYPKHVISEIAFTSPKMTNVIIPCSAYAQLFGEKYQECHCSKLYYDVKGIQHKCEFLIK